MCDMLEMDIFIWASQPCLLIQQVLLPTPHVCVVRGDMCTLGEIVL